MSLFMNYGRRILPILLPYEMSRRSYLKLAMCFGMGKSFCFFVKAIEVIFPLKLCATAVVCGEVNI
jgi:hypothetical protein